MRRRNTLARFAELALSAMLIVSPALLAAQERPASADASRVLVNAFPARFPLSAISGCSCGPLFATLIAQSFVPRMTPVCVAVCGSHACCCDAVDVIPTQEESGPSNRRFGVGWEMRQILRNDGSG